MPARHPGTFRAALALLRPRLVALQIGLGLLVSFLAILWLRLPDSSALWLAATALLAILIVLTAGAGESALLLRLTARPRTPQRLLLGTVLMALAVGLWYVLNLPIDRISANDALRAGYLNSRFGQGGRYLFTYEHLLTAQVWLWTTLRFALTGLLAACALASAAAPARAIRRTLGSITFWLAVLLAFFLAPWTTSALEAWVPGHGLPAETLSLALRLLAAILLYGLALTFLLCAVAACIRSADPGRDYLATTPAGTPLPNHPRTTAMP